MPEERSASIDSLMDAIDEREDVDFDEVDPYEGE